MVDARDMSAPAQTPNITSQDHEDLLNTIDKVRALGVGRYLDIPQVVVCGDQSSGKSSVLEGVGGLHFEVGDGLCTRFPTEYALRRSAVKAVTISIIPESERSDADKSALASWKPSTSDLNDFPTIMKEATAAMGIGKDKTFAHDRLRIEVSGPSQPHLTLVDVPGLFHSSSKSQSEADRIAVFSLVTSYVKNPRSIIMAVVSAKNDPNNQIVLEYAKKYDPGRKRTIGIVTKPDTLSKDSPSELHYYNLARNNDVYFTLGWGVLRNRSFEERSSSPQDRDAKEKNFFDQGIWKNLDSKMKGVASLRQRLGGVLHDHILTEMPNLLKDLQKGIDDCRSKLDLLGTSRATNAKQRLYLLRASQKFSELMTAAVQAKYDDYGFFGDDTEPLDFQKRLRAVSMSTLNEFAKTMRLRGHAVELRDNVEPAYKPETGKPLLMTRDSFHQDVKERIARNQGCELPGFPSAAIIPQLFFKQSSPWKQHLSDARDSLIEAAQTTIAFALSHVADAASISGIYRYVINQNFAPIEKNLNDKVEEILAPLQHGHAITFNHYFPTTLKKMQQASTKVDIVESLRKYFGVDKAASAPSFTGFVNIASLADHLANEAIEPDSGLHGAIHATNGMLAYYKTQLKSVIDNFGIYAIEVCLLSKLSAIFTPEIVLGLDDDTISKIAGESSESIAERRSLTTKLAALQETQKILHLMNCHKPKIGTKRVLEEGEIEESEDADVIEEDVRGIEIKEDERTERENEVG